MSLLSGSMGAVMGSGATEDAANKSAFAQILAMQRQGEMFNQQRKDFAPFQQPSERAMALLKSGAFGGPQYYTDQNGNKVEANYAPTESASFQYNKQRTLDDLGRQLRMMGRGTGTVAANAMGRTLGDLTSANEDKYNNSLLNLAKIGQGAAGSTSSASQNYANNYTQSMNGLGNTMMQGGMARANLYAGLGNQSSNAIGNAYQGYKIGQGLGLWGGSGAGTAAATEAAPAAIDYAAFLA